MACVPNGVKIKENQSNNKNNKEINDFKIANGFKEEADSLFLLANQEFNRCQELINVIPCVILISFACELYSKAILYIERGYVDNGGKVICGHKLYDLYEDFSDETKNNIKSQYTCEKRLEKIIEEISSSFEFWRYFPEHIYKDSHISLIFDYAAILKKEIETLRIDLTKDGL